MKRLLSIICAVLLCATMFTATGCSCGGKGDNKIEIVVDGGGVSKNYNSSISMTPSPANPNPYNELEMAAERYNKTNDKYKIKISRTSINGSRDTILGYVTTKSGPDIIYQLGTNIAEDMGKGYFVDMTDYLNKPNKYAEGNKAWKDLYDSQELEATRAPDGNFYSVGIDRNVAGIMYNKDIFAKAGIDFAIETYGDFIKAMEMVVAYDDTIMPYVEVDNWYDIILEGNLYGGQMKDIDVIRPNGVLDAEELARAKSKNLYRLKNGNNADERYMTYLTLIQNYGKFLPASNAGLNATTEFVNGKVAMVSCLGKDMMMVYGNKRRQESFEMGVTGYPRLTNADIVKYGKTENVKVADDKGIRRGVSGIGTGWWITNSAIKKGTVDACVDFLQYVTAPVNNGPIVNKLGVALPLDMKANGESVQNVYQDLVKQYNADVEKDFYVWHVFHSWGIMGFDYWSKFYTECKNIKAGNDLNESLDVLAKEFERSYANLLDKNTQSGAWDVEKW